LLSFSALAQDIHFSQFFNSPLNTNPGLTGIFNGDIRFGLHFRNQWHAVPVDYLTFSGFADKKFYSKKHDKGFWSGGLLLNYDRSGDSHMSLGQGAISGSYTMVVNKKNLFTLGAQVGVTNLSVDFGQDLKWDSQFNGYMFEERLATNEYTDKEGITYLDFGGGVNYRWQKSKRTKIDLGVGVYHFTEPDAKLYEDAVPVPMRITANFSTSFKLSELFDFKLHGLAQFQDEYREYVPAFAFRIYVNKERGKEFALDIGGLGRLNDNETDALTPYVAFEFKNWFVGINYDINTSGFDIATDRIGGPEIHVRHIITNVKPMEKFKNCPIF
jgi:type IX secretion system PorP/SprF family membrane protein